jgi:hypothetical protein
LSSWLSRDAAWPLTNSRLDASGQRRRPAEHLKKKKGERLMPDLIAFKSGKDQGEETRIALVETVTCIECGEVATDEQAYDQGWQIDPVVCPDCLHWTLTPEGESCCGGAS